MDDDKLNKLFYSLNSGMSAFNAQLDKNNELLSSLISRQKERDKKEEKFLFKEVVVLANNDKESSVVNNPDLTVQGYSWMQDSPRPIPAACPYPCYTRTAK